MRIVLVGVCAISAVLVVELRPWQEKLDSQVEEQLNAARERSAEPETPPSPLVDPGMENSLRADTARSIKDIDPQLEVLMAQKSYGTLTNRLLNLAAQVLDSNQPLQLAEILSLLGQVSIEQQNLDAAEMGLAKYSSNRLDMRI